MFLAQEHICMLWYVCGGQRTTCQASCLTLCVVETKFRFSGILMVLRLPCSKMTQMSWSAFSQCSPVPWQMSSGMTSLFEALSLDQLPAEAETGWPGQPDSAHCGLSPAEEARLWEPQSGTILTGFAGVSEERHGSLKEISMSISLVHA